jgi:hypothetical protein
MWLRSGSRTEMQPRERPLGPIRATIVTPHAFAAATAKTVDAARVPSPIQIADYRDKLLALGIRERFPACTRDSLRTLVQRTNVVV